MKNLLTLILLYFVPLCVSAYVPDYVPTLAERLATGKMLVANRTIQGGVFRKSVILLTHYGQGGTIGLIINQPSIFSVQGAVPGLLTDNKAGQLFIGGPVQQSILSVLIKTKQEMAGLKKVLPNIYHDFGASIENANGYLSAEGNVEAVRFYAGYAGWATGQLEAEIKRGDWIVIDGDPDILFNASQNDLWQELLRKAGK